MPAQTTPLFAFTDWSTLVIPGVGVLVAVLVPALVYAAGRLRRKPQGGSKEEDLSWEDLLEVLRHRKQRKGGGQADEMTEDESLEQLLAQLPASARRAAAG